MNILFAFIAFLLAAVGAEASDIDNCANLSGNRAIQACDRIIKSGRYEGTDLAEAYVNRGQEYYLKNNYDRAIADITEGLRLDAEIVQGWVNRGNARSAKGQIEEAIADYTQAIKIDPETAAGYTGRGMELEKKGELKGALADYKTAITASGDYTDKDWAHKQARERIKALEKK